MYTISFPKRLSGVASSAMLAAAVVAGAMVLGGGATTASAETIYQDSFNRTGDLNGSQLGVATGFAGTGTDGGSATAAWTAPAGTSTTAGTGLTAGGNGQLPFVPALGDVYTLTADITMNQPGDNFSGYVIFGFSTDINTPVDNAPLAPLMFVNGNGGVQAYSYGPWGYFSLGNVGNASGVSNDLQLVLDTTQPLWTVSAFINGTPDGSFTYNGDNYLNPSIVAVGVNFKNNYQYATFTNFSLSDVPEPTSLALLAIGGLLVLPRRRRQV